MKSMAIFALYGSFLGYSGKLASEFCFVGIDFFMVDYLGRKNSFWGFV